MILMMMLLFRPNAAAAFTCDRLSRWIAGERLSLWDSCTTPSLQRVKMSKQHKQSLAMSLVREGFDKKACSTLTAEGLVEPTRAALDKLRPLHPSAPPPSVSSIHMLPPGPSFDSDAVLEALRGFPRDSAPGPSGLRAQHLLDAVIPGHDSVVLEQLVAAGMFLARGDAPSSIAHFFAF